MRDRNKIPVLDFYHDRVSQALWPKFTAMFQLYISSVQRSQPRNFRVNQKPNVHSVVSKYVQFVVGIYKMADLCDSGQDMVMHRLTLLKGHLSELIVKMSVEHYGEGSSKLPLLFKVNNLYYISRALSQLGLQKSGVKDLSSFEKELDTSIENLIDVLL